MLLAIFFLENLLGAKNRLKISKRDGYSKRVKLNATCEISEESS